MLKTLQTKSPDFEQGTKRSRLTLSQCFPDLSSHQGTWAVYGWAAAIREKIAKVNGLTTPFKY